jgi:membrane-bound lytic murein transglycosylase D
MKKNINYFPLLIGLFFCVKTHVFAQKKVDTSYTVELPAGYTIGTIEDFFNDIVQAATFSAAYELSFDTLNAIGIGEEIAESIGFEPTVPDDLLIDRLSCIQNEIPLTFHPQVRAFVDYFTGPKRDFTLRALGKKDIYFPLYERIFEEYGIPAEMKYLSIIESALDPFALSPAKALGLWQFIPSTGKIYGLRQNNYIDERSDPEKSTRAAAKYLKQLYHFFDNDWELAISAYNCGPGNVKKAMRKASSTEFWEIYEYLPRETRSYLPSFVAMMYVLNYADEHNLINEKIQYPIDYEEIYVNQFLDLRKFAKALKVCFEDLKELNPELKTEIVPATAYNYPLKIPVARFDYFLSNREAILDSASNRRPTQYTSIQKQIPGIHIVEKGESVAAIARKYAVTVENIREWNMLLNDKLHAGQKVIVSAEKAPKKIPLKGGGTKPVAKITQPTVEAETSVLVIESALELGDEKNETNTTPAKKAPTPQKREIVHTVKSGESLSRIAEKYSLNVSQIKNHNGLRSDRIAVGQSLKIPLKVYGGANDNSPVTNQAAPTKSDKVSSGASKPASKSSYYTVKKGDSLWEIARNHSLSVQQIKKLNPSLNPNNLSLGQKIRVK